MKKERSSARHAAMLVSESFRGPGTLSSERFVMPNTERQTAFTGWWTWANAGFERIKRNYGEQYIGWTLDPHCRGRGSHRNGNREHVQGRRSPVSHLQYPVSYTHLRAH